MQVWILVRPDNIVTLAAGSSAASELESGS